MKISNAFPSKYLKASDLQGKTVIATIGKVIMETFTNGDTGIVMYFQGKQKGMSLNKTKGTIIGDAYGDDTDNWTGKQITLSPGKTMYQGRTYDVINVSIPQGQTMAAPQPMTFQDQQNQGCNDFPDDIPEDFPDDIPDF